MIRITVQIGDVEDESKTTVIASSFDNFDEVEETEFLNKIRMFDDDDCYENKKKKKKHKMGFSTNDKYSKKKEPVKNEDVEESED